VEDSKEGVARLWSDAVTDLSRLFSRVLSVFAGARTRSRRAPLTGCGHVPARPDADLTICWKCSIEIICDPGTRLWRPLTAGEMLARRETTRQLHDLFLSVSTAEFDRILFERLRREAEAAPVARVALGGLGRWIIVNGEHEDLAWSGSRWVPHYQGFPTGGVQIVNFATHEEAQAYADDAVLMK
jgi:hypothetical protein